MDLTITKPAKIESAATLPQWILSAKTRIDRALNDALPPLPEANRLRSAMRYTLLNGGKRIRPAIIYALASALAVNQDVADTIAIAIEAIHASSLIHDDLPALDDDAIRRSQPACHIAYGEAIAILAGDALLNFAYEKLTSISCDQLSAEQTLALIQTLSIAIGEHGLIGGQACEFYDGEQTAADIISLYTKKTASLMQAAVQMTIIASQQNTPALQREMTQLMQHVGLAFQIHDDILDVESSSECLGKPQFSDQNAGKQTLLSLVGMQTAKQMRDEHIKAALLILENSPIDSAELKAIIHFIIYREY